MSNASSVMVSSVSRTGRIRFPPQVKRVSGASIGVISSVPSAASA